MNRRAPSLTDTLLTELDTALRVVAAAPKAARTTPQATAGKAGAELSDAERDLSTRLLRVNHSGEIAAQALYRGQAMVARDPQLRAELLAAADEEHDHLAWCQQRAEQLGGGVSRLTPAWYAGSFVIGMLAGLTGDRVSLGFLAETERQVTKHLAGHLERLPDGDHSSRAILEQMRADEIRHAEGATARGGIQLPKLICKAMTAASRVMTSLSFRV
jgi:ubiquinone biosynthesis monooxygenase Coq7